MAVKNPTIDQLRDLVQQASRENPHLTSRVEKAAFLVLLRPLECLGDDPVGTSSPQRRPKNRRNGLPTLKTASKRTPDTR